MSVAAKLGQALVGWKGHAVVGLAAAALASGAVWTAQGWRYAAQLAELRNAHAQERADLAQVTVAAAEAVRNEERRRMAALEITRADTQKQAAAAAADAASARSERDRLHVRANALARAAVARDPALADGRPAGTVAVDLLAYMLGRAVDRAEALAGVADRARIAGLTCERAYATSRGVRGN